MKIAFVFSNEYSAPAPDTVIVASQHIATEHALELKRRGHEVVSIVGKGSKINTSRYESSTPPFANTIDQTEWKKLADKRLMYQTIVPFEIDLQLTLLDYLKKNDVDLVQFHAIRPYMALPLASRIRVPSVFTYHSPGTKVEADVINTFTTDTITHVSISKSQQLSYPGLTFGGIAYNGLSVQHYSFNLTGGDDLAYIGRFLPEKGAQEAIKTAIDLHMPIHVAGEARSSNSTYFEHDIEPLIHNNPLITIEGMIPHSEVGMYLQSKKALLFPIRWEEPFGLVMIEAMACGTPVIAFARGSVPEIINDGETGYIVNPSDTDIRGDWIIKKTGIAGLKEAVERMYALPKDAYMHMRQLSRRHVESMFTIERMVDRYESIYNTIIKRT